MSIREVRSIIVKYVSLLRSEGIDVKMAFLFGSYAKGRAREDSDIDVCIVSESFGKNRLTEGQFLFRKARIINSRIEPIPCSYKELKHDKTSPLLAEIKKNFIRVV